MASTARRASGRGGDVPMREHVAIVYSAAMSERGARHGALALVASIWRQSRSALSTLWRINQIYPCGAAAILSFARSHDGVNVKIFRRQHRRLSPTRTKTKEERRFLLRLRRGPKIHQRAGASPSMKNSRKILILPERPSSGRIIGTLCSVSNRVAPAFFCLLHDGSCTGDEYMAEASCAALFMNRRHHRQTSFLAAALPAAVCHFRGGKHQATDENKY